MPALRRSIAFALLACFALAPAATRADEAAPRSAPPSTSATVLNFVAPKAWTDTTRPNGRLGLWRDWMIRDGAAVHSLVLSVTREALRALPHGDAAVAMFKTLPNVAVLDSGPTTVCGDVPAFGYTYRSDRTPGHPLIIRHVLVDVGPALGDVSYAHAPGVADRADALEAMSTLCDKQIYAMRAPPGWRRDAVPGVTAKDAPGVDGFTAPTGTGALIALAVSEPVRRGADMLLPKQARAPAAVIGDAEEQCGNVRVRHAVVRVPGRDGAATQLIETVAGYRHGATYLYSYVHPEAEPADPSAQRALTSFCDANAALATPPPAPV